MNPARLCLCASTLAYVTGIFILSPLPGLSMVPLAALLGMLGGLVLMGPTVRVTCAFQANLAAAWAFGVYGAVSVFWAQNVPGAAVAAGSLITALLGGTLVYLGLWNGVPLSLLAWAAAAAGALQSGLGVHDLAGGDVVRATGLAGNANALSVQLSIISLIILAWKGRPAILTVAALAFVVTATIVTGSRQVVFVWVALAVMAGGWVRNVGWKRGTVALALVAAVLLSGVGLALRSGVLSMYWDRLLLVQRFIRLEQGGDHSSSLRWDMVREGIQLWSDSPIWGQGVGQFRYLSSYSWYAHDNYIELLSGLGVIGLILFLTQHALLCLRGFVSSRRPDCPQRFVPAVIMVLLLWDIATVSYYQKPFWVLMGVLWYVTHPEDMTHKPSDEAVPSAAAPSSQRRFVEA